MENLVSGFFQAAKTECRVALKKMLRRSFLNTEAFFLRKSVLRKPRSRSCLTLLQKAVFQTVTSEIPLKKGVLNKVSVPNFFLTLFSGTGFPVESVLHFFHLSALDQLGQGTGATASGKSGIFYALNVVREGELVGHLAEDRTDAEEGGLLLPLGSVAGKDGGE